VKPRPFFSGILLKDKKFLKTPAPSKGIYISSTSLKYKSGREASSLPSIIKPEQNASNLSKKWYHPRGRISNSLTSPRHLVVQRKMQQIQLIIFIGQNDVMCTLVKRERHPHLLFTFQSVRDSTKESLGRYQRKERVDFFSA